MPLKKKMKPTICSSFDLIEESMTEGWRIGAITEYLEEWIIRSMLTPLHRL